MTFGMIVEDPFYDEDGVLIDEDADWEDVADPGDLVYNEDIGEWLDKELAAYDRTYSPFDTINS